MRFSREPTVWWHAANTTTLILGAAQPMPPDLLNRSRARGVTVVKRQAGGTSVLATDQVLGLDVVLPRSHSFADADVVEGYRWIGEVWREALHLLGVQARTVTIPEARAEPALDPDIAATMAAACFGRLSPYEVVVNSRKMVGLAQVRRSQNVLLASGVHRAFDAEMLIDLISTSRQAGEAVELRRRAAGLDEFLVRPPEFSTIMEVWSSSLLARTGTALVEGEWTAEESAHVATHAGPATPQSSSASERPL